VVVRKERKCFNVKCWKEKKRRKKKRNSESVKFPMIKNSKNKVIFFAVLYTGNLLGINDELMEIMTI